MNTPKITITDNGREVDHLTLTPEEWAEVNYIDSVELQGSDLLSKYHGHSVASHIYSLVAEKLMEAA